MNNCKYCGKFAPLDNIKSGYEEIYSSFEIQEVQIFHRECQILYVAKLLLITEVDNGITWREKDVMDYFQIDNETAIKAINKADELIMKS